MLKLGKVCVCFHSNLTDQQPGTPLPLNVHWLYFIICMLGKTSFLKPRKCKMLSPFKAIPIKFEFLKL